MRTPSIKPIAASDPSFFHAIERTPAGSFVRAWIAAAVRSPTRQHANLHEVLQRVSMRLAGLTPACRIFNADRTCLSVWRWSCRGRPGIPWKLPPATSRHISARNERLSPTPNVSKVISYGTQPAHLVDCLRESLSRRSRRSTRRRRWALTNGRRYHATPASRMLDTDQ